MNITLTCWIASSQLAMAIHFIQRYGVLNNLERTTMLDEDCYRAELSTIDIDTMNELHKLMHKSGMLV